MNTQYKWTYEIGHSYSNIENSLSYIQIYVCQIHTKYILNMHQIYLHKSI